MKYSTLTESFGESLPAAAPPPANVTVETVLSVRHWTSSLFSFRLTRPQSLRFRSGEFIMVGLMNGSKPILRAYSIASPAWDDELEFYSIKVPDGPLTSRLQLIQPGDRVLLGRKPTGTLVHDALIPGERLYLLSTGTGIAPFASLVRDPETYERFERVILVHTCRTVADLAYGREVVEAAKADPLVGELAQERLQLFNTLTREAFEHTGRITTLMETGALYKALGAPPLSPATDRVMICGSKQVIEDVKALVEKAGLTEGSNAAPGQFVVERAFVG